MSIAPMDLVDIQQVGNRSATPYSDENLRARPQHSRVACRTLVETAVRGAAAKSVAFRPPVYLSDQWGCPEERR